MKKKSWITFCCLLFLTLEVAITSIPASIPNVSSTSSTTVIRVIPETIELGPENVSQEFDVAVVVEDVTDFYGFDVQLKWNTTYLEYVSHTFCTPWNDTQTPVPPSPYAGILYEPGMQVKDVVDEDGGISGAEPETMGWWSYASMDPAPPFDGNGTVVAMTFMLKSVPIGEDVDIYMEFVSTDLSNTAGVPLPDGWDEADGNITLHGTSPISLISPTHESPIYTRPGENITVSYEYTHANPKNVTIKVYNATEIIGNITVTDLEGDTGIRRNDTVYLESWATDGYYSVNVSIYTETDLLGGDEETAAVVVDGTPPTIEDVSQDPLADNVQPDVEVEVTATVTDTLSEVTQVILSYRHDTTWINVTMDPDGDTYTGTIDGFSECTNVTYLIIAEDMAGNTISTEVDEYQYHVIPEFSEISLIAIFTIVSLMIAVLSKRTQNRT